jgi:hypothetical protein
MKTEAVGAEVEYNWETCCKTNVVNYGQAIVAVYIVRMMKSKAYRSHFLAAARKARSDTLGVRSLGSPGRDYSSCPISLAESSRSKAQIQFALFGDSNTGRPRTREAGSSNSPWRSSIMTIPDSNTISKTAAVCLLLQRGYPLPFLWRKKGLGDGGKRGFIYLSCQDASDLLVNGMYWIGTAVEP